MCTKVINGYRKKDRHTMELNIEEGITLVNRYGEYYNIQFIPKSSCLDDVVTEFKQFLIACGYTVEGVNEYMGIDE